MFLWLKTKYNVEICNNYLFNYTVSCIKSCINLINYISPCATK